MRPQADQILAAQMDGTAMHHARWRDLTEAEHAAAVGELRELAAGRADLLAEPRQRQAAPVVPGCRG